MLVVGVSAGFCPAIHDFERPVKYRIRPCIIRLISCLQLNVGDLLAKFIVSEVALKFRVATSVKVDSHSHDVEFEVASGVHGFDLFGWLFI